MPRIVKPERTPDQTGPLDADLLGRFVRARRTQSKLSLEDAAMLCHVAKDTLSKIENARDGVRFESILLVCKMLGVRLFVEPWEEEL